MRSNYSLTPAEIPRHEPAALAAAERMALKEDIRAQLDSLDAVLVAHYYETAKILSPEKPPQAFHRGTNCRHGRHVHQLRALPLDGDE